mgnify:CR=1 FL=1
MPGIGAPDCEGSVGDDVPEMVVVSWLPPEPDAGELTLQGKSEG